MPETPSDDDHVTEVDNSLDGRVEDHRERAAPGRIAETRARIAAHVVGRERELELVLAAVAAGRDMLLEGPPGTSKSTILRAITAEWGIPLVFVEGNADLTPAKLIGHHNPARVLREDYTEDNFVDGPLVEAMRSGGFLYIEEFNRAPEDTINTLLTAMAEREVAVPRVGRVAARPSFRVIASMNPYDNVGTTRLSTSVHDRLCRLAVTYQDEAAERGIVALRAQLPAEGISADLAGVLRLDAVALTRATRAHPDIRQGSSVRGAIDLTLVAGELLALRGISSAGGTGRVRPDEPVRSAYAETVYDAAIVALSGRIHLDETVDKTPEVVLREIWEDQFVLQPAAAAPG
jgi:MoxR-like ATPase